MVGGFHAVGVDVGQMMPWKCETAPNSLMLVRTRAHVDGQHLEGLKHRPHGLNGLRGSSAPHLGVHGAAGVAGAAAGGRPPAVVAGDTPSGVAGATVDRTGAVRRRELSHA